MNQYLFVLDENGRRKTSYVVGVHADTIDELKEKAKKEFPNCTYMDGTEEQQNEFLKGKKYLNGAFINDVDEPTEEEKAQAARQQLDAEYESEKSSLADSLTTAILQGDTDTQASIQADYKDLEASYAESVAALNS